MKQQKEDNQQINQQLPHKTHQQSYQQLILRKRLIDRQISNVKSMSLHQLLDKNRKKQPILPPSPTMNYVLQEHANALRRAGFQNDVEELAQKHAEMILHAERKNAIMRRQRRQAPIFSQIKRGKLGMDSVLILFALIGSVALPYIFYHKFKINKEIIVKSRKYSPEVIENISDDSHIDIDTVSEQSIHYDNPARRHEFQKKLLEAEKISALKRDLDM